MRSPIQFEIQRNGIATLTLHRPEVRNALNWELMQSLTEKAASISNDGDMHALIITGSGDAFCSGGDLFELHNYASHADGVNLACLMGDALSQIAGLPIPVIAAIEGPAIGGGAELALACDVRIASQKGTIGFPQINLALTPAWGGAGRLIQSVGYTKAFSLLSSGVILDSQEAFELGLFQKIVADGQAQHAATALAMEMTSKNREALLALKRILHAHLNLSTADATAFERRLFADLWASDAHQELASAFIKRDDSS